MRDATSVSARLLGTALMLACCLQATVTSAPADEAPLKSDNPQMDDENSMSKRDWNKDLHIWGKRGWNNIRGGWGLKRSASWADQPYFPPPERRSWQKFQGGWGKRVSPEDEYAVRELAAMLDQDQQQQPGDQYNNAEYGGPLDDLDVNDDEKRNWGQFHGGWGKRSKWEKFRGSWGKREPAWSNLKGIWGKRSALDQNAQ